MNIEKKEKIDDGKSFETIKWINKVIKIFGEEIYDFTKSFYTNSKEMIIIECKRHGDFEKKAGDVTRGFGCSVCVQEKIWLKKVNKVHNEYYDYSKAIYMNNYTNVIIICPQHKEFEQTPDEHAKGKKCPKCPKEIIDNKALTTEEFIERATKIHKGIYDYSDSVYVNCRTKVEIYCKKCEIKFWQLANSHLRGSGCEICYNNRFYTTETWKAKAKSIYGDLYDYSKSIYKNTRSPIIIICKKEGHGEFTKWADQHFGKDGKCDTCTLTEEWIEKAKAKHGNTYDYSKSIYKNSHTRIIIICEKHEEFEQFPETHLTTSGCLNCYKEQFLTTEDWIQKAVEKYGDTYDYSKVNYINYHTPVTIICKKGHGEFLKKMYKHLAGEECYSCTLTKNWISRAIEKYGEKYDYSKVDYTDSDKKIIIICNKNRHEFLQNAAVHMTGHGCPQCSSTRAHTTDEWINIIMERFKNISGRDYDYSKVVYKNTHSEVEIICKNHGSFFQTALSHYYGAGCPSCFNKTEGKLYNWLKFYFSDTLRQKKFNWCENPITNRQLPFDFYIEELDCIIELDGGQHFKQVLDWNAPEITTKRDVYKMQKANANNICVVRLLQEDVFKKDDSWLDHNLLPVLMDLKESQNYYIAEEKHGDIYSRHKELYDTEIIFDENIEDIIDLEEDEILEQIPEQQVDKKEIVIDIKTKKKKKDNPIEQRVDNKEITIDIKTKKKEKIKK
jgi:hypothetical protein